MIIFAQRSTFTDITYADMRNIDIFSNLMDAVLEPKIHIFLVQPSKFGALWNYFLSK